MHRGPLYEQAYKPQFSGHETFPLRYGWLKKAYDAVRESERTGSSQHVFVDEGAIGRFGVGKNMVAAIRYWASACNLISESRRGANIETTQWARDIFKSRGGLDPYLEQPTTLWLMHWAIAARPERTTWFWVFNHFQSATFERDDLMEAMSRLAKERNWQRVAAATIKGDVACFIRTYLSGVNSAAGDLEESVECPLSELGLLRAVGKRSGYRLVRGPKWSLGPGVFAYAVIKFWLQFSNASTLSLEAFVHEPGSPGRVFLLEEGDVAARLADIEKTTKGALRWSETAGLRQLIRSRSLDENLAQELAKHDFRRPNCRKVA